VEDITILQHLTVVIGMWYVSMYILGLLFQIPLRIINNNYKFKLSLFSEDYIKNITLNKLIAIILISTIMFNIRMYLVPFIFEYFMVLVGLLLYNLISLILLIIKFMPSINAINILKASKVNIIFNISKCLSVFVLNFVNKYKLNIFKYLP
jgi:hypothetical protein